jgi:hypothetical protein
MLGRDGIDPEPVRFHQPLDVLEGERRLLGDRTRVRDPSGPELVRPLYRSGNIPAAFGGTD